jgi:hypothetical protein
MASSKTIIKQIEAWVKKQIKGAIEDVEGQMESKGPGVSSYTFDISEKQVSAEIAAAAKADLFAGKAVSLILTKEGSAVAVTPLAITSDMDDGHFILYIARQDVTLFEWPAESQEEPTPEKP